MKRISFSKRRLWQCLFILALVISPLDCFARSEFDSRYDRDIKRAVRTFWPEGPDWSWLKAQLYAESALDPGAKSPVGAMGIAQFMPGTWEEMRNTMPVAISTPYNARDAIAASAFYMHRLRVFWRRNRTVMERHILAVASYNAGPGSILKAQALCRNALLWSQIEPCLVHATGRHSKETIGYVARIQRLQKLME